MSTTTFTRPFGSVSTRANDIIVSLIIGVALTALSYVVGLAAHWITSLNPIEVFAVFTSYVSTYLCVRERRFNYVAGAVSSAAYAVLFFQSNLLASMVLNAYLAVALVYGWIRWRRDDNTKPVEHVKLRWVPVYILVTAAAYFGAVLIINALGAKFAFLDAAILALTILAQFLLDNKKLENWIIWALVNVIAIYEYFSSGLYLVGFQYIFFLANTVYGFIEWRKSMKALPAPAEPAAQVTNV